MEKRASFQLFLRAIAAGDDAQVNAWLAREPALDARGKTVAQCVRDPRVAELLR